MEIIGAHNHPSGGLEPSASDAAITAQLKGAGEMVGVELLDHITSIERAISVF